MLSGLVMIGSLSKAADIADANPMSATVKATASILNAAKTFDPSGILGIVAAFVKENCYYQEDFNPQSAITAAESNNL